MKFIATDLAGAYLIQIDPMADSRGFFARLWCREEFQAQGIEMEIVQASVSHNVASGTLRGLHFQRPPSREAKLVRCERGRVHDVIVDLRPDSSSFTRHIAVELDSRALTALYVPPGFAHGYQTLEENSDLVYMMSGVHRPELADGVRFDDPRFDIVWPLPITNIAQRDRDYPDFDPVAHCRKFSRGSEHPHRTGSSGSGNADNVE